MHKDADAAELSPITIGERSPRLHFWIYLRQRCHGGGSAERGRQLSAVVQSQGLRHLWLPRPRHRAGSGLVAGTGDHQGRWRRASKLSAVRHDLFARRAGEPDFPRYVAATRRCDRLRDIVGRRIDQGWVDGRDHHRWHRLAGQCACSKPGRSCAQFAPRFGCMSRLDERHSRQVSKVAGENDHGKDESD
jgi:hypothetical protein